MNEISTRNLLRLYSGPIVSITILVFIVGGLVALLMQTWLVAAVLALAVVAAPIYFYRALFYWVKLNRGLEASERGSYVEAETLLREARACTESFADDDWRRVFVLEGLVQTARAQGNYDEAETCGLDGLAAAETACGREHAVSVHMMLVLAGVYVEIAQYAKAEPLLQRCASLAEKTPVADSLRAECLSLQGRSMSEQGREASAETYHRQAFELVQKDKPESSLDEVPFALNLAMNCARRKNLAEASTLIERCIQRLQRVHAAESPLMAEAMDHQALVKLLEGHMDDAEEIQRRALALTEKTVGPNMPAASAGLKQLGDILTAQGRHIEAESCYRDALRLREEYLAPEHPALAEVLECYADLLYQLGRTEEAKAFAHRAGHIRALYLAFRIV
jgi:tetratricopeptide (TPR) repeat protein